MNRHHFRHRRCVMFLSIIVLLGTLMTPPTAWSKDPSPRVAHDSQRPFAAFTEALTAAIRQHKMGLVCRASAQAGAASIGVTIPGNQVFMVFRPDFAIRMLEADVAAGFEAPLRIYVTEQADGTTQISYIKPSDVFAGYQNAKLDAMAKELDAIVAAIVSDALK